MSRNEFINAIPHDSPTPSQPQSPLDNNDPSSFFATPPASKSPTDFGNTFTSSTIDPFPWGLGISTRDSSKANQNRNDVKYPDLSSLNPKRTYDAADLHDDSDIYTHALLSDPSLLNPLGATRRDTKGGKKKPSSGRSRRTVPNFWSDAESPDSGDDAKPRKQPQRRLNGPYLNAKFGRTKDPLGVYGLGITSGPGSGGGLLAKKNVQFDLNKNEEFDDDGSSNAARDYYYGGRIGGHRASLSEGVHSRARRAIQSLDRGGNGGGKRSGKMVGGL